MAIKFLKPAYWITVLDAFFCFIEKTTDKIITYDEDVYQCPVIKEQGIAKTASETTIYASGKVYDYISRTQGAQITLGAVNLPQSILDKAEGVVVNGSFKFDTTSDSGKEFAYGYYLEQSDGSHVYYWHPRCKLTSAKEDSKTSGDKQDDPSREFVIIAMPTAEGLWRVRYFTNEVPEGETALTPEKFFAAPIYTREPTAPIEEDDE